MRASADSRLRRILAMVPWIAEHEPTVGEVCERFGITEAELADDVQLLSLCGVAPFTPDVLIEAGIVGDQVSVRFADWFRRPLRLTATEALALVASAQALLAVEGTDPDGPLARGLAKVASTLGIAPGEDLDVELGEAAGTVLATVQGAAAAGRQVELDYYSFGRDRWSVRTVDPWAVFSSAGSWYVRGHCHQAGGERLFRVDRVRSARVLDTRFEPPADPPARRGYEPGEDDPVVVLEVEPSAGWVAAHYPNRGVEQDPSGRLRISLPVAEPGWLERLLVRLGPDGRVVEGPPELAGCGREAARRILARYHKG